MKTLYRTQAIAQAGRNGEVHTRDNSLQLALATLLADAGLLQHLGDRDDRTDAHDLRRHPADGKKPVTIFGPDFPFAFDDWIEHPAGLGSIPEHNHGAEVAIVGAGIAGLGGVALSQISNVGPDMGQGYIVDAFMVVVLGGVGQLAGAVWAALGLGVFAKLLEGWSGAVIAKIVVLVFIIIFIQKRPQGLFALKGRFVD